MTSKKSIYQFAGTLIYALGLLGGALLATIIVWGDLEGTLFTSGLNAEKPLRTLNCPAIITPNETSQISVVLKNPSDKEMRRFTRAYITEGYVSLVREIKEEVFIPVGEKRQITWDIQADDAAYGRIVLFRVYINAWYPYPSLGANCGVMRVDVPLLTGSQVFILLVVSSILLLIVGAWMRNLNKPTTIAFETTTNSLYALAVTLAITILIGYWGFWVFGVLGLACALLLTGIIIGRKLAY